MHTLGPNAYPGPKCIPHFRENMQGGESEKQGKHDSKYETSHIWSHVLRQMHTHER